MPKLETIKKKKCPALAGVAQWIECWPANQRVAGWIPCQGTCLGSRPGPQWAVRERQPHTDVSLPLFLSKNKYIKSFLKMPIQFLKEIFILETKADSF